jgi:hypothetical protein
MEIHLKNYIPIKESSINDVKHFLAIPPPNLVLGLLNCSHKISQDGIKLKKNMFLRGLEVYPPRILGCTPPNPELNIYTVINN